MNMAETFEEERIRFPAACTPAENGDVSGRGEKVFLRAWIGTNDHLRGALISLRLGHCHEAATRGRGHWGRRASRPLWYSRARKSGRSAQVQATIPRRGWNALGVAPNPADSGAPDASCPPSIAAPTISH